jgi:hypothetical protein
MFNKGLLAGLCLCLASLVSAQTPVLVAFDTSRQYTGVQINDGGTVIGGWVDNTLTIPRGWAWSGGSMLTFNLPSGYTRGGGRAINNGGTVAGTVFTSVPSNGYPTYWNFSGGSYNGLVVSSTQMAVRDRAMNSAGEACANNGSNGLAYMIFNPPNLSTPHVFNVPPWPGNTSTSAIDINDSSTILASSGGGSGGGHSYIAFKGATTPYYTTRTQIPNTLPNGMTLNKVVAINNNNQVLGIAHDFLSKAYGFIWSASGGFVMLPSPPSGVSLTPIDFNDNNDVVGSFPNGGNKPFAIWGGTTFQDLTPYFAGIPNLEVNEAVSINHSSIRQIIVNGAKVLSSGGSIVSQNQVYMLDMP